MFLSADTMTNWSPLSVNFVSVAYYLPLYSPLSTMTCVTIETEHNVTVYGIHADFSLGPKVFQEIHDVLYEFEVGILGE